MDNSRFWILLSKHLANEASKEEGRELQNLLKHSDALQQRYDSVLENWGKSKKYNDIDVELAYKRVSQRMERADSPRSFFFHDFINSPIFKAAAMLFFCLGLGWIYFSQYGMSGNMALEIKRNSNGEKSKITLSDGSAVWLNGDSELKYPKSFSNNEREIYLTGEAFFDVTKNPDKPFIIHLADGTIRVLGTSFNVKSFTDDKIVETSVVTGRVAFIPKEPIQGSDKIDTVVLRPNFKSVYSRSFKTIKLEETNSLDDKAWVEGRLIFKSMRFEDVGKVLERTYGKGVVFDSENLKNCKLTGVFENNTLEEILRLFAETNEYKYSISVNEIHIGGIGCMNEE